MTDNIILSILLAIVIIILREASNNLNSHRIKKEIKQLENCYVRLSLKVDKIEKYYKAEKLLNSK